MINSDNMDFIITILLIIVSFIVMCLFALWRISKEIGELESEEELDNFHQNKK
jgi:hypothetical protein